MIIAVEGIDGSGKSTLVRHIAAKHGVDTLSFPTDQDNYQNWSELQFKNDRAAQYETLIEYLGHREKHIVIDRFVLSGAIYQAWHNRVKNPNHARHFNSSYVLQQMMQEYADLHWLIPDYTIITPTSVNRAQELMRESGRKMDDNDKDMDMQRWISQRFIEAPAQFREITPEAFDVFGVWNAMMEGM